MDPLTAIQPKSVLAEVANNLRLSIDQLRHLAQNAESMFHARAQRLVKGKMRQVDPPTRIGRDYLRRLNSYLQHKFPPHKIVHGGALGRSCYSSALVHCGKSVVVTLDIHSCYPSVNHQMVQSALMSRGCTVEDAEVLTSLLVIRGSLPQGSPASGSALNIVLHRLDEALFQYTSINGIRVSRTYDDIVLSCHDKATAEAAIEFLDLEISKTGLQFSRKKRKKKGLQLVSNAAGNPIQVHGFVVNSPKGVRIGPKNHFSAVTAAEKFSRACKSVSPQSIEQVALLRRKAMGHKHYCKPATYGPSKNISQHIRKGDRLVEKRLRDLGIISDSKPWYSMYAGVNEPRRIAGEWIKAISTAGPKQALCAGLQ
ncbi:MAG: reverse transcriptase domain-containing protein [Phycisphaerales bacterium]